MHSTRLDCAETPKHQLRSKIRSLHPLCVVLLLLLLLLVSMWSSADDTTAPSSEFDFNVEKLNIQWSPGERYNGLKGVMDYAHTDISWSGNGKLPIDITRLYYQGEQNGPNIYGAAHSTGPMALAIPTVFYVNNSDFPPIEDGQICEADGQTKTSNRLARPVTLYLGESQIVFFDVPSRNQLRSADGWFIDCLPNNEPHSLGNLMVNSPDGVRYFMTQHFQGGVSHEIEKTFATSVRYQVRTVSDAYGNTLTYNYSTLTSDNDPRQVVRLDSIAASDGRVVTINYKKHANRPTRSTYEIESIQNKSRTNPVKISYAYAHPTLTVTENDKKTTVITFSQRPDKITRIQYPTGGHVDYVYDNNNPEFNAGQKHDPLARRTTSDGGSSTFSRTEIDGESFVRRIRTPSAYLEYDYVKAASNKFLYYNPQRYTVNSGRMIRFRRSEHGGANTPGRTLIDTRYSYQKLYSVSDLARQAADRVVPLKTTVNMNIDALGIARSVFVKNFLNYDGWGYPTEIQNLSPANLSSTTNYTYRHTAFARHHLGKVTSISDLDDQISFSHNTTGDVIRHTVNNVTTTYDWYTTGPYRGEMSTKTTSTGKTTRYNHYKRGVAQQVCTAANRCKNVSVDDNGLKIAETRFTSGIPFPAVNEAQIRYQYDTLRRIRVADPARDLSTSEQHTWVSNNELHVKDLNNRRYERVVRLDSFGRKIVEGTLDKDQNRWSTVEYRYDSSGRLTFESFPQTVSAHAVLADNSQRGTTFGYDALNRVTSIRVDGSPGEDVLTRYAYGHDSQGNLTIAQTDGRGATTTTSYQALGSPDYSRPMRVTEPDGTLTNIFRTLPSGRINGYSRAGLTALFGYNDKKLLDNITQPEDERTDFTYYDDGLLKSRSNNGRTTSYEYYADDQIRKETYTDPNRENVTREFRYDRYGNLEYLITSSDNGSQNNTVKFIYDDDNNVIQQDLLIDSRRFIVRFSYDELSGLSGISYPNDRRYSLNPNSVGDPTSIRQEGGDGKVIYDLIRYNADHSMHSMRRNNHEINNAVDASQRPLKNRITQLRNDTNSLLGEKQYFYDAASNVSRINDTVNNLYSTFQYDRRNRLTASNTGGDANWSFTYSVNDDIQSISTDDFSATFSYAPHSRHLLGVKSHGTERRFEYDPHGNMTTHERINGSSTKLTQILTYNAANQLAQLSDGSRYAYDARGLRVKTDRNGSIYTLYGPNENLLYRLDSATGVSSEYFYVDGKLIARRDRDPNGG